MREFFGGRDFYGIPCNATQKGEDPLGRIVHDYGYYPAGSYSVNTAHSCTSVEYLSAKEVMRVLDGVKWYVKADLESGYRQFGTHPVDWRFQVYCNGLDEHYIDLACPFGKTNSSLEFCPMVTLFTKSVASRYAVLYNSTPSLGTHVDDIFGGFKGCDDYAKACHLREFLCSVGTALTITFNPKPEKTPMPATSQVILGRRYNSSSKRVNTSEKKVIKYRLRIASALLMH